MYLTFIYFRINTNSSLSTNIGRKKNSDHESTSTLNTSFRKILYPLNKRRALTHTQKYLGMIRISFHCCQNIISAWKWVFFSKKKKKNFGEKKNVSGEGRRRRKRKKIMRVNLNRRDVKQESGRRRRNIYKDIMQFFAFLMLWLESSRDNRRNSLFFFFSQNRKKKESKKDNIHVERRRGGERETDKSQKVKDTDER